MLEATIRFLSVRTRGQITAIAFSLIAFIGVIDFVTGYEVSFSIFYLVPVSICSWYATGPLRTFVAIVSAITWFGIDYASGAQYSHPAIPIWNAGVRLGFFLIVAHLLARLRVALEAQASLAQQDSLTGVMNSRAFEQRCEPITRLAARHGHPVALGYLDLDGFKGINDSLGHHGGDMVLKAVATTIAERLRASDVVARIGGDEFAILLPETDLVGAQTVFNNTREALLSLADRNGWAVGFSIGVTVFHPPAANLEDAIRCADGLMYKVKNAGKNSILFEEYSAAPHVA
jgi:diguanylate cyclase (GGDEF)-like protein